MLIAIALSMKNLALSKFLDLRLHFFRPMAIGVTRPSPIEIEMPRAAAIKPVDPYEQVVSELHPAFHCIGCSSNVAQSDIAALERWAYEPLLGDNLYIFNCAECCSKSGNGGVTERICRLALSTNEALHIAIHNLASD